MPILDQYGNPITSGGQGKFANAANRGDRSQPPEPLFIDDFDKLVPNWDRKALVSGSRKMFMNFPPYEGMITMKADNVVGRAWDAQFLGDDKEWGAIATDWLLNQYYGMSDVNGADFKSNLWLDCVSLDRDGDFLIVFEPTKEGWPMTRRISANRIGTRFNQGDKVLEGKFKGLKISQGVIYDSNRYPVAYNILGDVYQDDVQIDKRDCVFVPDRNYHDQSRGMPVGASALKFIRSSLLSHEWEQMAQLMVSSIGLVEYNENGGPDIDDPSYLPPLDENGDPSAELPTTEVLQNGTIRYFRSNSGGKVEQIAHTRPGDMWETFNDRVIRMMCKSGKWPFELTWKASDINAAMVRNIQEQARMAVEDRQDTVKIGALRQVRYAVARAMKEGIIPNPKNPEDWYKWGFNMPRKFSIDAGKDAQQRREDYKIGIKNKSQIVAEEGGNLEQLEDDRIETVFRYEKKIRERETAEGFKVDRRKFEMMTPNDMETEEGLEPTQEPDPKPKPKPEDDEE